VYRPAHFRQDDPATLAEFIDKHALATLVVAAPSGLIANHIPLLRSADDAGAVRLRGHVARGNDLWQVVADGTLVLAVFGGPEHYVSPAWYPTKALTGEVVPTWNYVVVHAHGRIRFIDDRSWVRDFVTVLTARHESGRPAPWSVSDAPAAYLDRMLGAIVGFEIAVERLEGKFKSSQNRNARERQGVVAGLSADGVNDETQDLLVRPPA
jgi:transcriptional regulator